MDARIKKLWLDALRSGEYQQGMSYLRFPKDGDKFCCLGVLCELYAKEKKTGWEELNSEGVYEFLGQSSFLPSSVVAWAGLDDEDPTPAGYDLNLAGINDDGASFAEIAEIIEEGF